MLGTDRARRSHDPLTSVLFETERLLVRHLHASDVCAMHAVYGDAEVMRWVGERQSLDQAQCAKWIEVTHKNYAARGYGMSALVLRQTGVIAGFCGIVHPGGQMEPEIKYALLREFWGKGLASEAVRAMLAYGVGVCRLTKVIATTAPENTASHRVLLKAGMHAAELRENADGTFTKVFTLNPALA